MVVTVNLNENAEVKLTSEGMIHYEDYLNKLFEKNPRREVLVRESMEELRKRGFVRIQLYELMKIFGHALQATYNCRPFEGNSIEFRGR